MVKYHYSIFIFIFLEYVLYYKVRKRVTFSPIELEGSGYAILFPVSTHTLITRIGYLLPHTYTYTYTYIHAYIYYIVCVYIYVCLRMCNILTELILS